MSCQLPKHLLGMPLISNKLMVTISSDHLKQQGELEFSYFFQDSKYLHHLEAVFYLSGHKGTEFLVDIHGEIIISLHFQVSVYFYH